MKKKGFTLVEVLFASGIFSMILVMGLSVVSMMSAAMFDGQTEETNRSDFNDVVFYLSREIQSAEKVRIEDSGKKIKIKQHGSAGYTLEYSFVNDYPVGYLLFNNKKIIAVDFNESRFYFGDGCINAEISVVKNDTGYEQKGRIMTLKAMPRSNAVLEEQ